MCWSSEARFAAISSLDFWRHGARVTLVHRGPKLHNHIKYWILPDIENRIKNGDISAHFNTRVSEIAADYVVLSTPSGVIEVKNDFVFALTGYHPDYDFLRAMGIELSSEQCRPVCDPVTLESNVPGIYVAGVIVAGSRTNEIFIENGRFHGQQIATHLRQKLEPRRQPRVRGREHVTLAFFQRRRFRPLIEVHKLFTELLINKPGNQWL